MSSPLRKGKTMNEIDKDAVIKELFLTLALWQETAEDIYDEFFAGKPEEKMYETEREYVGKLLRIVNWKPSDDGI